MKSAKEFAHWLRERVGHVTEGVYLTREDVQQLTGRQRFTLDYINDVHFELSLVGMGLVTDTHRENFFLIHLPKDHWLKHGDRYQRPEGPRPVDTSGQDSVVRRIKP
ncbi:hypothetical protein [Gallaecimonas xiamenensis]|uniref:Uncharacterized protein n=1 Tax=Gallaecimonas xiamenensis 3-C-1 TaxID=745411 RepID=K2KEU0_9GAMM|nr:hypothetical protein [Gallaecimonas xiamenensis]EKE75870.1 hypothetical protein B3C1_05407 [Gallaecimonas xiamenensis 3-C-1]